MAVLFFCFFCALCCNNYAQNLPVINIDELPETVFQPNIISVKIHPFFRHQLIKNKSYKNSQTLGIKDIDSIFSIYNIQQIESHFKNVLSEEESNQLHFKHQLQLWYKLQLPNNAPIKTIIKQLQNSKYFSSVQPLFKAHIYDQNTTSPFIANDPKLNYQWSFNNTGQADGKIGSDIKLFDAWQYNTGNPNVIVSVHDVGIDLNHEDLKDNIAVGKSYNFTKNTNTIDAGNHGTHVAGTIAAVNNNGIGVSGIAGGNGTPNSGVKLLSAQIFFGDITADKIAESYIYAADNGAAISNNSWGYDMPNIYDLVVLEAIDYFVKYGGGSALQGGVVVCAAGNLSRAAQYYPCSYDKVISVAGSNNKDEKASYSTFGPWVDITAPGGAYGGNYSILSTGINNNYYFSHGTSMAAPHVTGVAALIASHLYGKASNETVKEILLSTTDDIYNINPTFKNNLGTGRLNAYKALKKANDYLNNYSTNTLYNIEAKAVCDSINGSFKKINSTDTVIVFYSNSSILFSPKNNISYNNNQNISPAVTVVYKGIASNFSILNNNYPFHYFKLCIVNNNQYSFAKDISYYYTPTILQAGNTEQNFDFPPYYPTIEWQAFDKNIKKDNGWQHTADSVGFAYKDKFSMYLNYSDSNGFKGNKHYLQSPTCSIKNADSVNISFAYAYAIRNQNTSDSLTLYAINECSNDSIIIFNKGGEQLSTTTDKSNAEFYPYKADTAWLVANINLPKTFIQSTHKIKFVFKGTNGKGNNIFLDNINIFVGYANDIAISNIAYQKDPCYNFSLLKLFVKNNTPTTITNFTLNTNINGTEASAQNINSHIQPFETDSFLLPTPSLVKDTNNIIYTISLPNNLTDAFTYNNQYSLSLYKNNTTINLPFTESFENNTSFKNNWQTQENTPDQLTWANTNKVGYASNSSAVLTNFFYNNKDIELRTDALITQPIIRPVFTDSIKLSYQYAHVCRYSTNSKNNFDTLQISYSYNCGNSWQPLLKRWGNTLQTTGDSLGKATYFTPTNNQWKKDSITFALPAFVQDQNLLIKFNNLSNFGNNVYLDDIHIQGIENTQNLPNKAYSIYPNPCNNYFIFDQKTNYNQPLALQLRIVNQWGKILKTVKLLATQASYKINTSNLSKGIYFVQIMYNNQTITEKILKH